MRKRRRGPQRHRSASWINTIIVRAALVAAIILADIYVLDSPLTPWLASQTAIDHEARGSAPPAAAALAALDYPIQLDPAGIWRDDALRVEDAPRIEAYRRAAYRPAGRADEAARANARLEAYNADLGIDIDPGDYRLSTTGPEPGETAATEPEAREPGVVEQVVQVQRGDTLLELLLRAGVSRAEAHEAITAMREVFNPRELKPGHEITLTLAPGEGDNVTLAAASFTPQPERDVNLSRDPGGRFTAESHDRELRRELIRASGVVRSSLSEAGSTAGVPGTIMVELIRAFSYDVDFQREVQPEDRFDIVFERFTDDKGRFAKDGAVLYGALTLSGLVKRVYRFVPRDGDAGYYNERGESVRKALLRTPIDGARLTSGFGNRRHPILGYTAFHRGVDFAAPSGTPIQAAGDGVIEQAGWNAGYGNYVRVRHNSEYATAYAHMSKIAAASKPGARVRQGQVLGYVGSTGRSTGPHLHYEILHRGGQVNPLGVKFPTGRRLEGLELAQFRSARAEIDLQVAGLEPATRIAKPQ